MDLGWDGAELTSNFLRDDFFRHVEEFHAELARGAFDKDDLDGYLATVVPELRVPNPSVN